MLLVLPSRQSWRNGETWGCRVLQGPSGAAGAVAEKGEVTAKTLFEMGVQLVEPAHLAAGNAAATRQHRVTVGSEQPIDFRQRLAECLQPGIHIAAGQVLGDAPVTASIREGHVLLAVLQELRPRARG